MRTLSNRRRLFRAACALALLSALVAAAAYPLALSAHGDISIPVALTCPFALLLLIALRRRRASVNRPHTLLLDAPSIEFK